MANHHTIPKGLTSLLKSCELEYDDYLNTQCVVELQNHSNHPTYDHNIAFILGNAYANGVLNQINLRQFGFNLVGKMDCNEGNNNHLHPDDYTLADLMASYP